MQKLGIYKQLIEQAFEPIIIRLPNGAILEWNQGATDLYGYTPEQAVGRVSHELLQTVFPVSREAHDRQLVREGVWSGELIHTTRDGRRVTVESRHQLFTFGDGSQWVLESNRPASVYRTRYRTLFEGMREAAAYVHMLYDERGEPVDCVYLEANPALVGLLGGETPSGRCASELSPNLCASDPETLALLGRVARTGVAETCEIRLPVPPTWLRLSVFSPEPDHVVVMAEDVTARKQAEEILAHSHAQLKSFVEHLPAAVAMLDRDLRYVAASRRWREDYKLGDQALVGRHHYDVLPEIRHKPEWQAVHRRALAGATERSDGDELVRADGTRIWQRWEVRPWHDTAGAIGGIFIYTEDITAHKQAEEALRASELRNRMVFENAATGIAIADMNGRFEQCNPAYCRLLGYTEDELRRKDFASLIHPDDRATNLAEVLRVKSGEQSSFQIVNRYVRKDGVPVWVRKFGYTLPGPDGKPARLVALVTDITDLIEAEAAIKQERDFSEQIIHTVPAIVLLLGADGRIRHANPYFEQLTGYRLEDIRGKEWFATFLPERDRDRIRALFQRAATQEQTRGHINAIVTRDGRERDIEWYDQKIVNADGKTAALLAIGLDVTARLASERERREDAARLELALEGGEMGAWDLNLSNGRSIWNAREHELFGIEPGEFSGTREAVMERVHPEDRERIGKALARAIAGEEPYREEFRVVHPNGNVRWLAGRAHPIRDANGTITRLIGVNYDITERKQEEQAREHRHEEEMARLYRIGTVNELAGGLAHELSQPLTAIQNYAGGCLHWIESGADPKELRSALEAINDQSARVVAIIRHLRSLIASGEPQHAPTDLNATVHRARELLKVPLARKNVTVTLALADALPRVDADALQIEQVLIILMRNAIDAFTGHYLARPAIAVCTARSGADAVEIAVSDNGPGVEPEALARLFEPFYTTKPKGMGLGLMLARSIVRAHNGSIRAETPTGGGLTMLITLPIERRSQ